MSRAFTLIELLAALVLLALLTTVVSISLTSSARSVQMHDVTAQILQYDVLSRQEARQLGSPIHLAISVGDATLSRQSGRPSRAASHTLPPGYSIRQVRLAGKRLSYGKSDVNVSTLGQTPSYALLVAGPADQQQWLFFAGLSGQSLILDNEREIDRIFQTLAPGSDAR